MARRGEFIAEIRRQLEAYQKENADEVLRVTFKNQNPPGPKPRVLGFVPSSPRFPGREVEFDVLPAYHALGQVTRGYRPDPEIYAALIVECTSQHTEGEFSTCFTELQKAFVKLKSLIRLVKHWYQLCKEKLGSALPPRYALELPTIYAWEHGSKKPSFNTAEGFRTFLELVTQYQQLRIYWTEYYGFENYIVTNYLNRQLSKPRRVILDPADPTGNLCGKGNWQNLALEAEAWLRYPCVKLRDGSPVISWDLPELQRRSRMTTRTHMCL